MGLTTQQKLTAAGIEAKGFRNVFHFMPSIIRVDMRNNVRKPFYEMATVLPECAKWKQTGDAMCFNRAEVQARLDSFLKTSPRGQIASCEVYLTEKGQPVLCKGHLRWSAMALAEASGIMGDIAGAKDGLRCIVVPRPKTSGDRIELELGKLRENEDALTMSPIDKGYMFERLCSSGGMTRPDLAAKIGVTVDTISRHIRLTTATLQQQLDLREGRLGMSKLLSILSEDGEGSARGKTGERTGVKRSELKNVFRAMVDPEQNYAADFDAKQKFTGADVIALLGHITGVDGHKPPKALLDLISNAPDKPKKPRGRPWPKKDGDDKKAKPAKKAPPKPSKKADKS